MNPVEQTELTSPDGNCFAACVASILELSLTDVPDYKGPGWLDRWQDWLAPRNLTFINFSAEGDWRPRGYTLPAAESKRGPPWFAKTERSSGTLIRRGRWASVSRSSGWCWPLSTRRDQRNQTRRAVGEPLRPVVCSGEDSESH